MTFNEILEALEAGKEVCWSNAGYTIIKDKFNQLFVMFRSNGACFGLLPFDGSLDEYFVNE